jgi:type IV pilus assembly protein PilO
MPANPARLHPKRLRQKAKDPMKQLLDQFKNLNTRDPGAWPPLPKAMLLLAVLIGIVVLGYFLDWQEEMDSLEAGRVQEIKLKDDYVAKQQQAINLDLYRQQLREIDSSFGALLRQLPNRSQMDALLVDINQAGLGRGLQFDLFKPAPAETKREFYAELPVTLKLTGTYHDMGQFASDIGQLSRIVTLNDIGLTGSKDGSLVMDVTAKTFRYLDDEEVAAQNRASKTAKAGRK